ncbi:MAG: putative metalloprotease CJM1_0395 family protein [Bacteroidota bacterium]
MIQNIYHLFTSSAPIITTNFHLSRTNHGTKSGAQSASDGVILSISPEARQLQGKSEIDEGKPGDKTIKGSGEQNKPRSESQTSSEPKKTSDPTSEINPEEERLLQRLKQNDLKVRTHERQHLATASGYVKSGPVYEYTTGPDGKRYAVGGHVSLDMSPVPNNPEATIRKAQIIKKAALAPANPSGADRAVAALASNMELQARKELQEEEKKNPEDTTGKVYNPKVKSYAQSRYQLGQAVNVLL